MICVKFHSGIGPVTDLINALLFFFRAAWNASEDYSDEKAVCPSLSTLTHALHCDTTEEQETHQEMR